jgi:hypothetical protein
VGIGVEGYGYGRMAEYLGHELRVYVAGEQKGGARVPEVMGRERTTRRYLEDEPTVRPRTAKPRAEPGAPAGKPC